MPKKKEMNEEIVQINEVRSAIRKEIKEQYGSIAKFLKTDFAKQINSKHLRHYLYDTSSINVKVLSMLCEHFELGTLTAEVRRVTTTTYKLRK